MADNATISTAAGNVVVGADEVSSTLYQRVKPVFSADGVAPSDAQLASATVLGPLPVNAYHATDYILAAGLALTPLFASIALSGSADVVTAVANKKIRVLALFGFGTTTGTIKFQSGASTDKTGAMRILDGTNLYLGWNPNGWFETAVGEKLNAVLATMTAFNGSLTYVTV